MPDDSGGKGSGSDAGSIELDTFTRAVARVPAVSPRLDAGGAATAPDLAGRTLLHFHIVERLGAGGMGVVYKAIDEKLRRPVAIKVLSGRLLGDERHRETLLREARSAAAVNHPNIAAIYEVHEGPEGAFFVMELVEGETLRTRLARTGALPVTEALRVALEIARGLARAHGSSVVHRDLKCENVMLTRDGHVKLLDFGLATVQGEPEPAGGGAPSGGISEPRPALGLAPTMPATPTPTTGGRIAGTPASMPPEQARGDAADARADVYAFGVVLYEMLSGRLPFGHRTATPWEWGDERSPAWAPQAALRDLAPKVPREVERLVSRCLAYDRDERPSDGAALVRQVEAYTPRRGRAGVLLLSVAVGLLSISTGALVLRKERGIPSPPAPTSSNATSARASGSSESSIRALTTDSYDASTHGVYAGYLSDDGTRLPYTLRGKSSFRVHELRTDADEWIPSPDGTPVRYATFMGEGAGERILVLTMRSAWSLHPDTKQATKIVDDASSATMSADGRLWEWVSQDDTRKVAIVGRTDLETGTSAPLSEVPLDDDVSPRLSPDGSLVAMFAGDDISRLRVARADGPVGGRSEAPRSGHDVLVDKRLRVNFNLGGLAWVGPDRLIVSMQESPGETNLWEIRIDPVKLELVGPPVQLTHWDHVVAASLKVHHALHAISFTRVQQETDVSLAKLEPVTRRLSDVQRLTLSERDELPGTWTADGRTLLYMSNRSGPWSIRARSLADESSDRPLVTGEATSSYPQLVLGDTAILFWKVPAEGAPLLMRAPYGPTNAPADVLFVSPDRNRASWGPPLPVLSRLRCAARGKMCVLLSYDSSTSAWVWYRLDPRDGSRSAIEGLPRPNPGAPWFDLSPDGRRLSVWDSATAIHVLSLDGSRAREIRKLPAADYGVFDADSLGMFFAPYDGDGPLSYLWDDGRRADIAPTAVGSPIVAPDGKHAAFKSLLWSYNVWIAENVLPGEAP